MRIRRKFLQLTRQTVPYGNEIKVLQYLPKGYKKDEHGNFYFTIGDGFTTMFTCHLDTACSYNKPVKHKQNDQYIYTDGTTILGADDKAGMVVLLYMIDKKVPGLYYFFIGEEVGCIGSSALAETFNWPDIKKVVSFDRRGTTSVITEQFYGRCCSDEFAEALSSAINSTDSTLELAPDDTGILTDSAQFTGIVPECTNISVGYYDEHTTRESQDISYLVKLCRAVVKIDWESLPIVRDPELDNYMYLPGWDDEFEDEDEDDYDEELSTNIVVDGKTKKMFISKTWIEKEREKIKDVLKNTGYKTECVIWDGNTCWCNENGDWVYIGNRDELSSFTDIRYIPYEHLREKVSLKKNLVF